MIRKFLTTTTVILGIGAAPALAGGVPTIDITSIAQLKQILNEAQLQLEQAIAQNLKLDEQTLKLIEQIRLMEDQIAALRESYDTAKMLLDGEWAKELIPEIPDFRTSLEDALRGQWDAIGTDGTVGGTSVTSIVDSIFRSAGTSTEIMTDLANSTEPGRARIGTQGNTGAMMGVAAEASAAEAEESLARLTELVGNIPDTKGLKEAIDLNTRMTAELGIQLGNIWQMEAAQTIGLGQAGVMTAATLAEEQKYLDLSGD